MTDTWTTSRGTAVRMRTWAAEDPSVTLLVVHGLVAATDVLASARPGLNPYEVLAAEGMTVVGLDLPGHGRSGGPRGQLTFRGAIAAIRTAVDRLVELGRPVVLLGVGLGGTLAAHAALEDDRVAALVAHQLMDLRDVRPALGRYRQRVAMAVAGRFARVLDPDDGRRLPLPAAMVLAPGDLAGDPALARRLWRHPQAVRTYRLDGLASILLAPEDKPDLAALRTPTLVIAGTEDRVQPLRAVEAIASRLTCEGDVWVLEGGSHQLLLEHHRAVVPVIRDFVRRHAGG